MATSGSELIVVRSLADSDLGLFAAHRAAATSKQRAININAPVARQLLSKRLFDAGGGRVPCVVVFGELKVEGKRQFGKTGKNWRLGGAKLLAPEFGQLDSKDFLLIRSVAGNDGHSPVTLTFVSRNIDRVVHAGIAAIVGSALDQSMAVFSEGTDDFNALAKYSGPRQPKVAAHPTATAKLAGRGPKFPPMPIEVQQNHRPRTIKDKVRAPHVLERMMQVAGDLSAPAQLQFMQTVEALAEQLRTVLEHTGGIIKIERDHAGLWNSVKGQPVGFVDGGLANLSMFGSAPIAARVGGYIVTPGERGDNRESFATLKLLIDELYSHSAGGVFNESFPDIGALRDAARISVEAAGAVQMLSDRPDLKYAMVHGALVNPVSRYSDVMRDGKVRHAFPNFSEEALGVLLPGEPPRAGRDTNFISVHLRQLELMQQSDAVVCGVVERESTTASVCRAVLDSLDDAEIAQLLPESPETWKRWFRTAIDPVDDDEQEGQRITDSLLFRCVLEPGEALRPVPLDRNEMRRAPAAWQDVIFRYPKPHVSYLQPTEWNAPVRIEMFEKDVARFSQTASLIMHCALLLPRYAFPVGLDIVDKFAKIPNWMSRPVNTHTAVRALKGAMDQGDTKLFDGLRRMLCGSSREWLLRPSIMR